MNQTHCPTCGRKMAATKPSRNAAPPALLSQAQIDAMSIRDMIAYYHKIAPYEDVRFALRIGADLPPILEARWRDLLARVPSMKRTDVYRELSILQGEWRRYVSALDDATGAPFGSAAWFVAQGIRSSVTAAELQAESA